MKDMIRAEKRIADRRRPDPGHRKKKFPENGSAYRIQSVTLADGKEEEIPFPQGIGMSPVFESGRTFEHQFEGGNGMRIMDLAFAGGYSGHIAPQRRQKIRRRLPQPNEIGSE